MDIHLKHRGAFFGTYPLVPVLKLFTICQSGTRYRDQPKARAGRRISLGLILRRVLR
jgi:hypothetical protein